MLPNQQFHLILASKSPRRSQLLREAGFEIDIRAKEVDESYPPELTPKQVPVYLAEKKALACQEFLQPGQILLAADTVVTRKNIIYGKPETKKEARYILKKLSGKKHQVITGVCLLSLKQKVSFAGISTVTLKPLSKEEIDFYIKKYEPFDKAGAYAIQEWIGLCKIAEIKGTYANIMGLPVHLVYEHLQAIEW